MTTERDLLISNWTAMLGHEVQPFCVHAILENEEVLNVRPLMVMQIYALSDAYDVIKNNTAWEICWAYTESLLNMIKVRGHDERGWFSEKNFLITTINNIMHSGTSAYHMAVNIFIDTITSKCFGVYNPVIASMLANTILLRTGYVMKLDAKIWNEILNAFDDGRHPSSINDTLLANIYPVDR